jgi:hypothetical protein
MEYAKYFDIVFLSDQVRDAIVAVEQYANMALLVDCNSHL